MKQLRSSRDGASFPELDQLVRARIAEGGYPGQPSHPICHGVGARAHESPYAHQAGRGTIKKGMVLAIEPGIYWPGGGGLRLEDNFLITDSGNEKLCTYPDDFRLAEIVTEQQRLMATTNSKLQHSIPKLAEKIVAEVDEDEIVAMCCDVINIPSPTGGELQMARVHARRACSNWD